MTLISHGISNAIAVLYCVASANIGALAGRRGRLVALTVASKNVEHTSLDH